MAKAEKKLGDTSLSFDKIISTIESKRKKGLSFHYGNIIILSITLIGLFLFFYLCSTSSRIAE